MEETRRAFHSQKQRACVIAVWVRPGKTGIESLLSPAYWSPWHRWALPEFSSSSNLPQEWDAQRQRTDNEGTTPRVRVRADWPGSATKAAKAVSENRCWFVHRLERMRLLHCLVIWRTVFTSLTALGCSLKARNPLLPAKCLHSYSFLWSWKRELLSSAWKIGRVERNPTCNQATRIPGKVSPWSALTPFGYDAVNKYLPVLVW